MGSEVFEQWSWYRTEEVDVCRFVQPFLEVVGYSFEIRGGWLNQVYHANIWDRSSRGGYVTVTMLITLKFHTLGTELTGEVLRRGHEGRILQE